MTLPLQYLINGRADQALSPLDRGFAYGDGVFRTMPVHAGEPLQWQLHYNKLVEDCNVLSIVCPSAEMLLSDIRQLCTLDTQSVAKIIISRGEASRGYALPALAQPTRVVIKSAMPQYPQKNRDEGVQLYLCQLRLPHQPAYAGIKHLNRLENILARMEWTDAAFADGILLDSQGDVIECTMSNIFIRIGQELLTPDLSLCGVAGVTRQRIMGFAEQLGLQAKITTVSLVQLLNADEVVICNSLYGTWQVTAIQDKNIKKNNLANELYRLLNVCI